jgi:hypothetical protein
LVLIVVVLIVLPAAGYLYLSNTNPAPTPPLSGLDVLTDAPRDISVTVSMKPDLERGIADVGISIDDAKEVLPHCHTIKFVLPGQTIAHQYLLPTKLPGDPDYDERAGLANRSKPLTDVRHDPLGCDVVTVELAKYPDFTGVLEYLWAGGIWRKS